MYKAVELDATSKRRTGREYELAAETRQAAIDALLALLARTLDSVQVDPSRTLMHVGETLWTLVAVRASGGGEAPSLRRGGAKHKTVR